VRSTEGWTVMDKLDIVLACVVATLVILVIHAF
jgi:hypothetical protein